MRALISDKLRLLPESAATLLWGDGFGRLVPYASRALNFTLDLFHKLQPNSLVGKMKASTACCLARLRLKTKVCERTSRDFALKLFRLVGNRTIRN